MNLRRLRGGAKRIKKGKQLILLSLFTLEETFDAKYAVQDNDGQIRP